MCLLAAHLVSCGSGAESSLRPPPDKATKASQPVIAVPAPVELQPGGIGSLQARNAMGEVGLLALQSVDVRAEQRGDMAEVEVEHVFRNDSDEVLEGTFRFPMPDRAILTGLAMEIGGKMMEGELVERDKAKQIYEAIVDSMRDPALLEWEQGTTFKLRVFPIEPRAGKKVVLRYLAPLQHRKSDWVFLQGTRAAGASGAVPHVRVRFSGRVVFDERNVERGRIVEVPAPSPSPVLHEQRANLAYTVVRLDPDASLFPKPDVAPPRDFLVAVDTSRSALEERKLIIEALRKVLVSLPPGCRFKLLASDLEVREAGTEFEKPTPPAIERAIAFLESIPPDGASDLGALLERIASDSKAVKAPAVVALGDFEPTWGLTDEAALVAAARKGLARTPLYPLVIGNSVNLGLAESLAHATSGRAARARNLAEVARFAAMLGITMPKPVHVTVDAPETVRVLPERELELHPGEPSLLYIESDAAFKIADLKLRAQVAGRMQNLMPKAPPVSAEQLSRRFGDAWVSKLEREANPKPEIVQASLDYRVMSKHTSFLVLESEAAYAQHAIERRANEVDKDAPRVSGADLESLDGERASISLTRFQPGDPEIYVDAPRDARVVVAFPFGETKLASYDPEANSGKGAFMVRFLVPRNTPEGVYHAEAHIYYRDGRHEVVRVAYVVDNTAPELRVELRPARRAGFTEVSVTQNAAPGERDLRRVEMLTPDGRSQPLVAIEWARFRGFVADASLPSGSVIRFVGSDQALNQSVQEVRLP